MNRFGVATPGHPPIDTHLTSIAPAPPIAPRRRGRAATLAALLVVAAGGAGFGIAQLFTPPGSPATVPVLAVTATLPPGTQLRAADVTVVAVRRPNLPKGAWLTASDEAAVMAGDNYAAVELPRGALLNPADLTTNPPPGSDQQIIGLNLKGSQAPVQAMPAGAQVQVLAVPDATQPPYPPAQPLGTATVWYSSPDGSGGTNVDLLIPSDQASTVAGDAAHGEISLILTDG